jgi:hypothetical protein
MNCRSLSLLVCVCLNCRAHCARSLAILHCAVRSNAQLRLFKVQSCWNGRPRIGGPPPPANADAAARRERRNRRSAHWGHMGTLYHNLGAFLAAQASDLQAKFRADDAVRLEEVSVRLSATHPQAPRLRMRMRADGPGGAWQRVTRFKDASDILSDKDSEGDSDGGDGAGESEDTG